MPFKFFSGAAENAHKGKMFTLRKFWGVALALGALLVLGPGVVPVWADGVNKPSARDGSDVRQFGEELRTGGALKFYEDTEDLLRAGKFERAFCRYLFLKAHIGGQALYVGLNTMVDWRLHFLKSQLRLGEVTAYKKPRIRVRRQARWVPPPGPPPPEKKSDKSPTPPAATPVAAKAAGPESQAPAPSPAEKPAELIIPPPVTADQVKTSPNEEKKSPGEEVQEEKPKEKKPAPPPSAWDKIKRRLKFW